MNQEQKDLLIRRATEMMGDRQKAVEWLSSPRPQLHGKTPFEYAEDDIQEILNYIGRIEHGVFQ